MDLFYKGTNKKVCKGDILTSFRGEKYIADYFREPTHGEGKIVVKKTPDEFPGREYYVGVFDLEWR